MTSSRLLLFFILIASASGAHAQSAPDSGLGGLSAERLQRIDSFAGRYVDDGRLPGVT
jgi:hypothetical protein